MVCLSCAHSFFYWEVRHEQSYDGVIAGHFDYRNIVSHRSPDRWLPRKKIPGPRVPNKLNRRDLLWLLIVIMVLILLGVPWGMLAPPRSDNRPVPISDR